MLSICMAPLRGSFQIQSHKDDGTTDSMKIVSERTEVTYQIDVKWKKNYKRKDIKIHQYIINMQNNKPKRFMKQKWRHGKKKHRILQ